MSNTDRKINELDKILSELGVGKYQIISFIILYLCVVMDILREATFIFTASDPSYRCLVPECETTPSDFNKTWLTRAMPFDDKQSYKCERFVNLNSTVTAENTDFGHDLNSCNVLFGNATEKCTSWVYEKSISIVEELEIPCEDWKRSLVGSLNSCGQIISFLFSGFISDKYGRRNVLIIMIFFGGVMGILQSFSRNYWMFAILEFITMASGSGAFSVAYVMITESLPLDRRIYGSVILEIVACFAGALIAFIGWSSSSWRWFMRICDIPSLFSLAFLFFLPESIRWLHAKGKGKECGEKLSIAAKSNGVSYSQGSLMELNRISSETISVNENASNDPIENDTLVLIFNSPRLLIRLVCCALCRLAAVLTLDGIGINSVNISKGDNIYLNFMLVGLVELPSTFVFYIVLRFMNRRMGMQISFVGAGVFCIIYASVTIKSEIYKLMVYLMAKFFIDIGFKMTYIYTSECFPTTLRNSAVNFCAVVGRIGGVLAPQFLLLGKVHKSLPMTVFGIVPFICTLLLFNLPNTRNKKLPNTIAEAEEL